ncbi:MAG: twin-arginine translocation signal domain-containing protein [Actinomyces urogenitalis]|uniref:twin-arginine translocation signal domain-containing protein n=1 Tax=Actinomyces urogenitalis TaxID=103621 RepID=UPI0018CE2D74|nr:twin-arginine translocation signal domain-containing protein [Actinomyces urogenitalis]MDU5875241.1 twin-arginine translocation signal domain-containing protein [Actinomyces urogenitalis]
MSTTMMSRRSLLQTTAVVSALAMAAGLSACGGGAASEAGSDVEIPAGGTDDGTELTMWCASPTGSSRGSSVT